jgi:hypothetical protein
MAIFTARVMFEMAQKKQQGCTFIAMTILFIYEGKQQGCIVP